MLLFPSIMSVVAYHLLGHLVCVCDLMGLVLSLCRAEKVAHVESLLFTILVLVLQCCCWLGSDLLELCVQCVCSVRVLVLQCSVRVHVCVYM